MINARSTSPGPVHRSRFPKLLLGFAVGACAAASFAPSAALANHSQSPERATCPGEISNPFQTYGDNEAYRLAPGGDFSDGAPGWTLSGGAELVSDTSPASGGDALALGRRDSALSAPICVDGSESFSRMFSRSVGGRAFSSVVVDVVVPSGRSISVDVIRGDDDWAPTSTFPTPRRLAQTGIDSFQYRFTAIGRGTTILDDLYVDPRAKR